MNRRSTLAVALAAGALTTTAASATPAEDMADMLQQWVGRSEAVLLEIWGDPAQRADRGSSKRYGYFGEGSSPSLSAGGFATVAGGKFGCVVIFDVDSRGVISDVSWSTEGAADRARARKACWREFRRNGPPE
jgi:hypothetical protein